MLTTRDDGGGLALVDGGANLGPSLEAAQQRIGRTLSGGATTVTVTGIRFLNDHQARATFDLATEPEVVRLVTCVSRPGCG